MCDRCQRPVSRREALWGLAAGLSLALPSAWADPAETYYTVRKHDTLYDIAQRHGVSVTRLAEHNRLARPDAIKPGQRLRIPLDKPAPALPAGIKSALEQASVKPGRWKYVVLHHSGTDTGSAKGMDAYHHKERHMENGLAYHFVIGNGRGMDDGELAVGRRWSEQIDGGHLASESLNRKALGICLVGNFEDSLPTEKQLESLRALVAGLLKRCKLTPSAVKTHQQINTVYTRCPGRKFPMEQLLKQLKG